MTEIYRDTRDIDVGELKRDLNKLLRRGELMSTGDCVLNVSARVNNIVDERTLFHVLAPKGWRQAGLGKVIAASIITAHLSGFKTAAWERIEYGREDKDPGQIVRMINRLKTEGLSPTRVRRAARSRVTKKRPARRLAMEINTVVANTKRRKALLWQLPQKQPQGCLSMSVGSANERTCAPDAFN